MELIEDLGMQFATEKSKVKARFGIYACPICEKHFRCTISNVSSGSTTRCRGCADKAVAKANSLHASTTFVSECSLLHSNRYNYSLVVYKNNHTPVKIICQEHGVFVQRPSDHKGGHGCPRCSGVARNTSERFIIECSIMHNNKYDYSLVHYTNNRTAISILCPEHGIFYQTPDTHKQGSGCPKCSWAISNIAVRMNSALPTALYYVYLPEVNLWKIGCTSRTLNERFGKIKVELIEVVHFKSGRDAYRLEQIILSNLQDIQYHGDKVLKGGNTELLVTALDFTKELGDAYTRILQTPILPIIS